MKFWKNIAKGNFEEFPPFPGFESEEEYQQVSIFMKVHGRTAEQNCTVFSLPSNTSRTQGSSLSLNLLSSGICELQADCGLQMRCTD